MVELRYGFLQAQIVGAKVVSPFRNAVGLIDRQ
jgi:hypothetical protein